MSTAFADRPQVDPLREQVETTLRRIVVDLVTLPCHLVRRTGERIARPVGVARSLVSLAGGGLLERFGATAPMAVPVGVRPSSVPADAGRAATAPGRTAAPSGDLPIADYESLAASQVVARLGGLDEGELRQVAAFELANRGRRTVLGKIEQLLVR